MPSGYYRATRHPWPCLLFMLPFLAAYEAGVVWLGGDRPQALRNGVDHWLRCALGWGQWPLAWAPPVALVLAFVVWSARRADDRPQDLLGTLCGMTLEAVAFALGLWGVSRALAPLLEHFGVELSLDGLAPALRVVVPYLGAGVYEEAAFRLVIYTAMVWLLRRFEMPAWAAYLLAALGSATLFATAHHVGPYGEAYGTFLFLFRLSAGLYFAALYQFRGFGIAVGTHACYNVMVSVGVG
jgi:hypothetical protein